MKYLKRRYDFHANLQRIQCVRWMIARMCVRARKNRWWFGKRKLIEYSRYSAQAVVVDKLDALNISMQIDCFA